MTPALLALGLFFSVLWGPSVFEERFVLHELSQKAGADFEKRLQRDLKLFPSEPYFWELRAERALEKGANALPFAAAALARAPHSPEPHLLVASSLQTQGALHQALRHLAWAVQYDARRGREAARLARSWTQDTRELELAIPARHSGAFLLPLVDGLDDRQVPWPRRQLLERAARENPHDVPVLTKLGSELVFDFSQRSVPCESAGRCPLENPGPLVQRIEQVGHQIAQLDSSQCAPLRWKASILAEEGDLTGADSLLASSCLSCSDALQCVRERVLIADKKGDARLIRATENLYAPLACVSSYECARAYEWLGTRALARKEWGNAANQLRMATGYESSPKAWLALARALVHSGDLDAADDALKKAREHGGGDAEVDALLAEARRRALHRALTP